MAGRARHRGKLSLAVGDAGGIELMRAHGQLLGPREIGGPGGPDVEMQAEPRACPEVDERERSVLRGGDHAEHREDVDAAPDLVHLIAVQATQPPEEFSFSMPDSWSRRLFTALLCRYGIQPYRYRGQRRTTVMARVPRGFLDETLWPEFNQRNAVLRSYLERVTERVIKASIYADDAEAEVRNEPAALADGRQAPR